MEPSPGKEIKRQNFNVDSEQAAELESARQFLNAPTIKDAILRSATLVNVLARELQAGGRLVVQDPLGETTRVVIPELEHTQTEWLYLCQRPHPWRRQLYIKGKKLLASTLCSEMARSNLTPAQVAVERDLPLKAVHEAIRYCQLNRDLIKMEAEEEKQRQRPNPE